jgi:Leucine-rich repeat (LRR) protein
VKDAHIVKLMNLPCLEELNLDSCLVGDIAIGHLADNEVVPSLVSLDLADTNLTDLGMVKIAKFKKLTRLSLFYCNITNNGLRHISKLTELQVLNLDSRDISDEGLAQLKKLTKLKSLDVFSGRITDAGCVHIAKIKSLELCGGGIGDLGCSLLASLENLTSLNLSQNDLITNRGAAAVATLTNLKALNLSNTQVDSSALRFFSGLLKLQSLAIYGCRGIDDEHMLGKLRNGLPNLRCLRLNTSSDEDGMVVATGNETDDEDDVDPNNNASVDVVWDHFDNEDTVMDDDVTLYSDHD